MKNGLLIGVSLLAALVLTLVLVAGTFAPKEDPSDTSATSANKETQQTATLPDSEIPAKETDKANENEKEQEQESEPKPENASNISNPAQGSSDVSRASRTAEPVLGYAIAADNRPALPEPAEKLPVSTVSFVACGDNLIHSSIYNDAKTLAAGTDREYNFLPMYENVADIIKAADLALINQESPFGGDARPISGYPLFNTPDQAGYDLVTLGFDIISIANNHMLDSTSAGYERTIDFWDRQENVVAIGGYKNKEDFENIRIVEKNGITIALLAYTYGTNGLTLPKNSSLVIPLYDDETIDRQTKAARKLADFVIVSVHWGVEDNFTPNGDQKRKAQIMVDNGVDVIIGHHPHVLQPMKWAERPDGGKTLIMYSLGNFLSGMMYSRNMVGGIMGFDLVKAPNGCSVENAYFIPTVCQYNASVRGFKIYRFSEYTEELQAAHGAHKFDSSMSMRSMRRIIEDAIPSEFLTEDFYS